jgi:hypothetical protein
MKAFFFFILILLKLLKSDFSIQFLSFNKVFLSAEKNENNFSLGSNLLHRGSNF